MKEKVEDYLTIVVDCVMCKWIKITYNGLKLIKKVMSSYLDLTTDTILLGSVIAIVEWNFQSFETQICIILLVSISVPLFTSACMVAYKRPLVILRADQFKRYKENSLVIGIARALIICFFFLVPAMIILSQGNAKERQGNLKSKDKKKEDWFEPSNLEENDLLTHFIDETRLALLTFKRNELSMELVVQMSVHLTMVLLSKIIFFLIFCFKIFHSNCFKKSSYELIAISCINITNIVNKHGMNRQVKSKSF